MIYLSNIPELFHSQKEFNGRNGNERYNDCDKHKDQEKKNHINLNSKIDYFLESDLSNLGLKKSNFKNSELVNFKRKDLDNLDNIFEHEHNYENKEVDNVYKKVNPIMPEKYLILNQEKVNSGNDMKKDNYLDTKFEIKQTSKNEVNTQIKSNLNNAFHGHTRHKSLPNVKIDLENDKNKEKIDTLNIIPNDTL